MIVVIDYGLGNLSSISNMLNKLGIANKISGDIAEVMSADKLILPGVGAFDPGMENLRRLGLIEALDKKVKEGTTPLLGICLGMQLLTERSEEGTLPGLGYIKGETRRFRPEDPKLKIPHMGWNLVFPANDSPLAKGFGDEMRFYFVHSYFVRAADRSHAMFESEYGIRFDSGVQSGHIFGVQFHPEKSHKFGMQLFKNFAEI